MLSRLSDFERKVLLLLGDLAEPGPLSWAMFGPNGTRGGGAVAEWLQEWHRSTYNIVALAKG